MAAQKRQCANCRYFQDAGMAGSGWCTHPKRQDANGVRLLVRRGELACRNSWGGDLFSSKDRDDESRAEPTIDPVAAADSHRPAPIDDEVTSVVTPPIRQSPQDAPTVANPGEGSGEDRVVSDRPAPRRDNQREEPDHHNEAARSDQDERARLIARGNSDALAHARERLFDRRRRLRVSDPDQDRDAVDDGNDEAETTRTTTFASPDRHRASPPQSRYFQRSGKAETLRSEALLGDPPVPRAEVLRRQGDTPSPDRYESIPEVDPGFDLPGWRGERAPRQNDRTPDRPAMPEQIEPLIAAHELVDSSDDGGDSPDTTYEHTLNRARRIRDSKRPSRPHTVRVDHFGSGQSAATQSTYPATSAEDHAAAYLPELDEGDGSARRHQLETVSGPIPDPDSATAHRERRPGWLEQFGIRRSANREQPRRVETEAPAAGLETDRPYLSVPETDDGPILNDDHDYADEYDQPIVAQQRGTLELIAEDTFGDEYSEVTYIPNTRGNRDADADERESRYILPDLDEVFAERTSATFYEPEVREFEQSSPRYSEARSHRVAPDPVAPGLVPGDTLDPSTELRTNGSGDEEQVDSRLDSAGRSTNQVDDDADPGSRHDSFSSGSRWSRDSTSSPRESWFRARRFQEWEQSQDGDGPNQERSGQPSGQFADAVPVSSQLGTVDHHSLPDLDAHGFDLRDIVERGGELLDMTIDIAPDIPRFCRSCRSFQSADGGVRGWCTNEWAFTHRRMVNEDDLACDSTIGCWWLPDDRYWQSEPEISWTLATPLIDAFIARQTRSPRRKISGE